MRLPLACWLLPALALATESPRRTPAEELDAELAAQVKIPGPELVVITDGPDPARFELVEGVVELDGRALPGPVEPGWGKTLFRGSLPPGNHVLAAFFGYRASRTGPYPWSGAYAYRVPGKVEFQAERGLRLTVHLRVEVHEDREDPKARLAFRGALEPEMIAQVDDTPVPPPPKVVSTPAELVAPALAPTPVASVPATPAPAKTKKPRPKKKTSVAAAPSLDAATARLQSSLAAPAAAAVPAAATTSQSKTGKKKPDAGTP